MTRFGTMVIAILITTNLGCLIYAFDRQTVAEFATNEAYTNLKEAQMNQALADSAAKIAMAQKDSATIQAIRANALKWKYDSLLNVCK